jgi:hypothetical protein
MTAPAQGLLLALRATPSRSKRDGNVADRRLRQDIFLPMTTMFEIGIDDRTVLPYSIALAYWQAKRCSAKRRRQ